VKASTMHNTHSSSSVFQSFKALWVWLMAKPGQSSPIPARAIVSPLPVSAPACAAPVALSGRQDPRSADAGSRATAGRSVRVLQVVEAGQSPAQSGRLRISGRMADVCAELDRLAAREALQH